MFEVEFRRRRPSDARSERCSWLLGLWFTVFAVIAILFVFVSSKLWASIVTVVILVFSIWFTWYYFHSAPPETEPVEETRAVEKGLSPEDIAQIPTFSYQRNNSHDFKDSNGSYQRNNNHDFKDSNGSYQRNNSHDLKDSNGSVDGGVGWLQCAVCIAMVKEGEMVRQLPMCKHLFHVTCIDKWLKSHLTCPMCRADVKSGEIPSEQPVPPV